jgi:hypothetical protein
MRSYNYIEFYSIKFNLFHLCRQYFLISIVYKLYIVISSHYIYKYSVYIQYNISSLVQRHKNLFLSFHLYLYWRCINEKLFLLWPSYVVNYLFHYQVLWLNYFLFGFELSKDFTNLFFIYEILHFIIHF